MAIQIIDGFKLSSARPIDDRIVASGSVARSAIAYKYEGLRVFDTLDGIPYVWYNNQWTKENSTGLAVPSTITPGYISTISYRAGQILKVYDNNKLLTNSSMFEVEFLSPTGAITGKTVAINHNTPSSVNSAAKLHVLGTIIATNFSGSGANITNIDPINFNTTTNKIQISQIGAGTSNYILRTNSTGTALEWVSASALSSGLNVSKVGNTPNIHYITFAQDIDDFATSLGGLLVYKTSNRVIGVIPSSGQIIVKGTSDVATPPYSFVGETNTGIYKSDTNQVSISISGNQKFEVSTTYVRIPSGSSISSLGLRFGGAGSTFNISNFGFYQGNSFISTVTNSDEVLRVRTTGSSQGSGSVNIYGNGGLLSLYGRSGSLDSGSTGTFIQFYRTGGKDTTLSPTRAGYFGFESAGTSDFVFKNETNGSYIALLNRTSNSTITLFSATSQINMLSNSSADFGTYMENTATSGGNGLAVRARSGEIIRSVSMTAGANYFSFYDGSNTTSTPSGFTVPVNPSWGLRTAWIGHWTSAGGNSTFGITHDSTAGKIHFRIGSSLKMEINGAGVSIPNTGTTMKSIFHGWFFCTYNTGGAGITSNNLYSSGMNLSGFAYSSGNATPFQGNANRPQGYIAFSTPTFTDINKVIVQVTPRYAGISQWMTFTPQVNDANTINIYYMTTDGFSGWNINSFSFYISIFEIVT